MTPEFERLWCYSTVDFVALGKVYGLDEKAVHAIIWEFTRRVPQIESMVGQSLLYDAAKNEYLRIFHDRLSMFRK